MGEVGGGCVTSSSTDLLLSHGDIAVYGRFEEYDEDRIGVHCMDGKQIQQSVTESSRQSDHSRQSWFAGILEQSKPKFRVFSFNKHTLCHWEYDWRSGNDQRVRGMYHCFRAYVVSINENEEWSVISTATSTAFTLSCYRKASDDAESETFEKSALADGSRNLVQETMYRQIIGMMDISHDIDSMTLALLASAKPCLIQQASAFAILHMLMTAAKLPWCALLGSGPVSLRSFLQSHFKMDTERSAASLNRFIACCAPFLSYKSTHPILERIICRPQNVQEYEQLELEQQVYILVMICWDLFCYLIAPEQWITIYAFLKSNSARVMSNERIFESHAKFMELLSSFCNDFLRKRQSIFVGLDALANEAVSAIFRDSDRVIFSILTEKRVRSLLQSRSILGVHTFHSQLSQLFTSLQAVSPAVTLDQSAWLDGKWVCRAIHQVDQANSAEAVQNWPAPLQLGFSEVTLMLQLAYGFELSYRTTASAPNLLIRSVHSLFEDVWSCLKLDGQPQTCQTLHDGVIVSIHSHGDSILYGDYIGQLVAAQDGPPQEIKLNVYIYQWLAPSIQLQLQLLPTSTLLDPSMQQESKPVIALQAAISVSQSRPIEMEKSEFERLDPAKRCAHLSSWEFVRTYRMEYEQNLQ